MALYRGKMKESGKVGIRSREWKRNGGRSAEWNEPEIARKYAENNVSIKSERERARETARETARERERECI